jgi:cobalt-zinc-cadmium efflux system membrane fusion protein
MTGKEHSMTFRVSTPIKVIGLVLLGLLLVGLSAAAMPRVKEWIKSNKEAEAAQKTSQSIEFDPAEPDTLRFVIPEAEKELGVRTTEVLKATDSRRLELSGSLAPNTDRLLPVRSRFPGEVMEIGQFADRDQNNQTKFRDIGNGDTVAKNDLLAVVWSKDLGLTKSNLLDALSKLRLDEDTLQKYEALYQKAALPERSLREARRNVESDRIAANAAELTLRSWRLTSEEIQEIRKEADRLADRIAHGEKVENLEDQWKNWARVEVRAPFDGTILEKNLALGALVDTTTNLFIIGDLTHLSVWANVYEEELPTLLKLKRDLGQPIPWTIRLKADPKIVMQGTIREIRPLIDPTQHAALVKGAVANPEGQLLAGEFITATVEIPPLPDEVTIPTTALVEDGQESIVFVQPNKAEPSYALRRVAVSRRGRDGAHLRLPTAQERKNGVKALEPGERVVANGALLMWAALKDRQDNAKAKELQESAGKTAKTQK